MKDLTEAQMRYYEDLKRLRGKRGQLLDLLLDNKWHDNDELAAVGGISFQSAIYAFRQEGWVIESAPVCGGTWKYRLTGKQGPRTEHAPMTRPQRLVAGEYAAAIKEVAGTEAALEVIASLPRWMQVEPVEEQ
jgi:hypothetical protein